MKTKAGTELPLMDIRGKPYLQVAYRLVWFREEHPDWSIETSLVKSDATETIAHAIIRNAEGRIIATAHKSETAKGFADHMEKCETGAIGRALALCGYGTQFEPDLDEGDRLADAPVAGPTHKITPKPQNQPEQRVKEQVTTEPKSWITKAYIEDLNAMMSILKWGKNDMLACCKDLFNLDAPFSGSILSIMTKAQYETLLKHMQKLFNEHGKKAMKQEDIPF